jgi:hypothetical protein
MWDPKIRTSHAPLAAMWLDPTIFVSLMGEKMCEFMFERSLDFLVSKFLQLGIQFNFTSWPFGASGCGAHARIP